MESFFVHIIIYMYTSPLRLRFINFKIMFAPPPFNFNLGIERPPSNPFSRKTIFEKMKVAGKGARRKLARLGSARLGSARRGIDWRCGEEGVYVEIEFGRNEKKIQRRVRLIYTIIT